MKNNQKTKGVEKMKSNNLLPHPIYDPHQNFHQHLLTQSKPPSPTFAIKIHTPQGPQP